MTKSKYNWETIEKSHAGGANSMPDNLVKISNKTISVSANVVNSLLNGGKFERKQSTGVLISIQVDKKKKAVRLSTRDDSLAFRFSIYGSGAANLSTSPKKLREASMPSGDYVRVGTSNVFVLAQ